MLKLTLAIFEKKLVGKYKKTSHTLTVNEKIQQVIKIWTNLSAFVASGVDGPLFRVGV